MEYQQKLPGSIIINYNNNLWILWGIARKSDSKILSISLIVENSSRLKEIPRHKMKLLLLLLRFLLLQSNIKKIAFLCSDLQRILPVLAFFFFWLSNLTIWNGCTDRYSMPLRVVRHKERDTNKTTRYTEMGTKQIYSDSPKQRLSRQPTIVGICGFWRSSCFIWILKIWSIVTLGLQFALFPGDILTKELQLHRSNMILRMRLKSNLGCFNLFDNRNNEHFFLLRCSRLLNVSK